MPLTGSIYSEGTWTPTIAGSSTPGTQTYNVNFGAWRRIGNEATCFFNIQMATKDGAIAGTIDVAGLPFPAVNTANYQGSGTINFIASVAHAAANQQWNLRILPGTSLVNLMETSTDLGGSASTTPVANLGATAVLIGSVTYRVA